MRTLNALKDLALKICDDSVTRESLKDKNTIDEIINCIRQHINISGNVVANISLDASSNWVCDKTAIEMYEAFRAGKNVFAIIGGGQMILMPCFMYELSDGMIICTFSGVEELLEAQPEFIQVKIERGNGAEEDTISYVQRKLTIQA